MSLGNGVLGVMGVVVPFFIPCFTIAHCHE